MDSIKKRDFNNNGLSQKMEGKKKCHLCEKSFFKEFMKKHMQVSHPGLKKPVKKTEWQNLKLNENGSVKCLFCNKDFPSMNVAKNHYTLHITKKISLEFKCKLCKKRLLKRPMREHLRDIHGVLKGDFKNQVEILRWEEHLKIQDGRVNCVHCNTTFSTLTQSKRHYFEQHVIKKNSEGLTCQICKKICRSKSSLESHMLGHSVYNHLEFTENGHVKCLDCNRSYKDGLCKKAL